jgi:2',3'-cyclic-nucleotide 2'-phosphodiesterase (5'-nucleotidase family)
MGFPSLHLSAGDTTLNGPFFLASEQIPDFGAPGTGDMAMLNAMGLQANCIGNHEFDLGIDGFATFLHTADFPMLAVNLDFSNVFLRPETPPVKTGQDGGPCRSSPGKVVKSCYIDLRDDGIGLVGIIGAAPDDLFNSAYDSDVNLKGLDFIGGRDPGTNLPLVGRHILIREQIDRFEDELGIDIIILIDHDHVIDYSSNPEQAKQFRGIDIILSAGSLSFWAGQQIGPYNMLRDGDEVVQHYPLLLEDAIGSPVVVIKADEQYRYVGNLIVTFDEDGILESYDGRSGLLATTEDTMDFLSYTLGVDVEPMPDVVNILRRYRRTGLIQDAFELVGRTEFYLEGNRDPVRSRETNLGRLSADAILWAGNKHAEENGLPAVDIALQNSGGIRGTCDVTINYCISLVCRSVNHDLIRIRTH